MNNSSIKKIKSAWLNHVLICVPINTALSDNENEKQKRKENQVSKHIFYGMRRLKITFHCPFHKWAHLNFNTIFRKNSLNEHTYIWSA